MRVLSPAARVAAMGIIAAGLLARVILAWFSWGSNDADIWHDFATRISHDGLIHLYRTEPEMNHPPIPALWSAGALRIAERSGVSFTFIFKLPMIVADAVACVILWKIWKARRGIGWGALA